MQGPSDFPKITGWNAGVGDDGDAWLKDLERCGNPLKSSQKKKP